MFRLGTLFVSIILFFQSINIHVVDVIRLGDLMEHANFHAQEYGDDWFAFFVKHYGEEKEEHEQKANHQEHKKLPFSEQICSGITVFVILPNEPEAVNFELEENFSRDFFYSDLYRFVTVEDFFQPPQYS
tara:strand:+ start:304 stop:693 length:390 start_codon:yes stop_codon:yes gene_type:complete